MEKSMVSVIMPVYNAEAYVGASLASILKQTYTDLQVIVVNDGSTDGSGRVIRSFNDPRLLVVDQPNAGVSAALNKALGLATGSLIARQDADDVSAPERIAEQVAFFRSDPGTMILGTWGSFIDRSDLSDRELERPTTDAAIRFAVLFDSPFVSTSVMFRADALTRTGGFDTSGTVWDDYDMWSRLVSAGKAGNIPRRLVHYRVLQTGLTQTNTKAPQWVMEQRRRNILQVAPDFPPSLMPLFQHIGIDHPSATAHELTTLYHVLAAIIDRSTQKGTERNELLMDLRARLMSCRSIAHRSPLHRVLDKIWKSMVLERAEGSRLRS